MKQASKNCKTCSVPKPLESFSKGASYKGGLRPHCKDCVNAKAKLWAAENVEHVRTQARKHGQKNKVAVSARGKVWRAANPERCKQNRRAYYVANKDVLNAANRAWALANPEQAAEIKTRWRLNNPEKVHASAVALQKVRSLRRPKWADQAAIDLVYANRPMGMVVDHYYPLVGEIVSGLHVASYLQYLTPKDNRAKWNYMPS